MAIVITACRHLLTDQSAVFDVQVREDTDYEHVIVLPCVTERDAEELARKLHDAITAHTNEDAILSPERVA